MTEARQSPEPPRPPGRTAAGYVLGICGIGVLVVLWLRGLLRPLLPLLLAVGAALVVRRIWRAITAPPPEG